MNDFVISIRGVSSGTSSATACLLVIVSFQVWNKERVESHSLQYPLWSFHLNPVADGQDSHTHTHVVVFFCNLMVLFMTLDLFATAKHLLSSSCLHEPPMAKCVGIKEETA